MIPLEGIDKIKVFLHPIWYSHEMWKYTQPETTKSRIDPYNHLTLHQSGMFISLAIHAEFFNPLADYRISIANAVYELIKKGLIAIPDHGLLTQMFVLTNLESWFVLGVQEVEFYFDMRPCNLTINEDAFKNGFLRDYEGSVYTGDYRSGKNKRKSMGIIYPKAEKNLKDNHIRHETVEQYPYGMRLEFRLTSRNCKYVNLENLRGSYAEIIKRFTSYLAIQFARLFGDYVGISGRDNKQLKRIVKKSEGCGSRYRGDELKKPSTIRVEKEACSSEGREQMQRMVVRQFYREQGEAETGQK